MAAASTPDTDRSEALADALSAHPPLWTEDASLLERAASVIRYQNGVIVRLRAEYATLRAITERQMRVIARLAEPACRQRREGQS